MAPELEERKADAAHARVALVDVALLVFLLRVWL
jgi:hypothetical protein